MAGDPTEAVVRAILVALHIPLTGEEFVNYVRGAVEEAIAAERAACEAVVRSMVAHPGSVADAAWVDVHNDAIARAADAIAARGTR